MRIDYTPLDDIDKSLLQQLVDDQIPEGKTIEYKENFNGGAPADKKEFLADVTSFANASGGHIIYGLKAKNGIPVELVE